MHAHSWRVEVRVRRPRYLGEQMLIGFAQVRQVVEQILRRYEGKLLNTIPPFTFQEPTTENLAAYLFDEIEKVFRGSDVQLYALTIWESPTSYVRYVEEDE